MSYISKLKQNGILRRNVNYKTIGVMHLDKKPIKIASYKYNITIIPSKYRRKKEVRKEGEYEDYFKNCVDCNKKILAIKKNGLVTCRDCYLDSRGLMKCKRCGSTKKKNDFLVCFRCFVDIKNHT